jgi:hypothetical protein
VARRIDRVQERAVLDDRLAGAVLGVAAQLPAVGPDHVVGGRARPEVTGRLVERRPVVVGEAGVDAERVERLEQRGQEQAVGVVEVARKLVGGRDQRVRDVARGVVVDGAAAGRAAGGVDPQPVTGRPVYRLGRLAVAERERRGVEPVDPDGPGTAGRGRLGGHLVERHLERAGAALLADQTPRPVGERAGHTRRWPDAGMWLSSRRHA